jgi:hypothetical protein
VSVGRFHFPRVAAVLTIGSAAIEKGIIPAPLENIIPKDGEDLSGLCLEVHDRFFFIFILKRKVFSKPAIMKCEKSQREKLLAAPIYYNEIKDMEPNGTFKTSHGIIRLSTKNVSPGHYLREQASMCNVAFGSRASSRGPFRQCRPSLMVLPDADREFVSHSLPCRLVSHHRGRDSSSLNFLVSSGNLATRLHLYLS